MPLALTPSSRALSASIIIALLTGCDQPVTASAVTLDPGQEESIEDASPTKSTPSSRFFDVSGTTAPDEETAADDEPALEISLLEASDVLPGFCRPDTPETAADAVHAAQTLIAITPDDDLTFAQVDAPERYQWSTFATAQVDRTGEGFRFAAMNDVQLDQVCALLDATLPDSGVGVVTGAMSASEVLKHSDPATDQQYGRDNYWIAIFGTPSMDAPWGFQIEGYNLALNVSFSGDDIISGPNLYGASPLADEGGVPVLDEPLNAALYFSAGLTAAQRAELLVRDSVPMLYLDSANGLIEAPEQGLAVAGLSDDQRQLLMDVVYAHLDTLPADQASAASDAVESELETAMVAWAGRADAQPFGLTVRFESLHLLLRVESNNAQTFVRFPDADYGG